MSARAAALPGDRADAVARERRARSALRTAATSRQDAQALEAPRRTSSWRRSAHAASSLVCVGEGLRAGARRALAVPDDVARDDHLPGRRESVREREEVVATTREAVTEDGDGLTACGRACAAGTAIANVTGCCFHGSASG